MVAHRIDSARPGGRLRNVKPKGVLSEPRIERQGGRRLSREAPSVAPLLTRFPGKGAKVFASGRTLESSEGGGGDHRRRRLGRGSAGRRPRRAGGRSPCRGGRREGSRHRCVNAIGFAAVQGTRRSSPTRCPRRWRRAGVRVLPRRSSARTRRSSQQSPSRHEQWNAALRSEARQPCVRPRPKLLYDQKERNR
jgi:hypothetical protein